MTMNLALAITMVRITSMFWDLVQGTLGTWFSTLDSWNSWNSFDNLHLHSSHNRSPRFHPVPHLSANDHNLIGSWWPGAGGSQVAPNYRGCHRRGGWIRRGRVRCSSIKPRTSSHFPHLKVAPNKLRQAGGSQVAPDYRGQMALHQVSGTSSPKILSS